MVAATSEIRQRLRLGKEQSPERVCYTLFERLIAFFLVERERRVAILIRALERDSFD